MLGKHYRLTKKKDFEKIFKEGKGLRKEFLAVKVRENQLKESRFGFVVSQKISKKAVVRNKIKRRLREIVRLKINHIKKGFDVVLIALPGIETRKFKEIDNLVEEIFKKSKILSI